MQEYRELDGIRYFLNRSKILREINLIFLSLVLIIQQSALPIEFVNRQFYQILEFDTLICFRQYREQMPHQAWLPHLHSSREVGGCS